jgi:hypothetical protein
MPSTDKMVKPLEEKAMDACAELNGVCTCRHYQRRPCKTMLVLIKAAGDDEKAAVVMERKRIEANRITGRIGKPVR